MKGGIMCILWRKTQRTPNMENFNSKYFVPRIWHQRTLTHALSNFIVHTFYAWNAALCALQHKRNGSFDVTKAENRALYWPIPYSLSIVTMIHCSSRRITRAMTTTTTAATKSNSNCYRFDGFVDQRILPAIDCRLQFVVHRRHGTRVLTCPIHVYPLKLVSVFHFVCVSAALHTYSMHVVIVSRSISCQICFWIWHITWHWRHGNASIR